MLCRYKIMGVLLASLIKIQPVKLDFWKLQIFVVCDIKQTIS